MQQSISILYMFSTPSVALHSEHYRTHNDGLHLQTSQSQQQNYQHVKRITLIIS